MPAMTTQEEKKFIVEQRAKGVSFVQIGKYLNRTPDSVRVMFNRIMKETPEKEPPMKTDSANAATVGVGSIVQYRQCKCCGLLFEKSGRSAKKMFYSDKCRDDWFNEKKRRTPYNRTCEYCGREFTAFGNPRKRFCSRRCFADSQKATAAENKQIKAAETRVEVLYD